MANTTIPPLRRCKGCGADILWGLIGTNAKRVPLNYPPDRRFVQVGQDPDNHVPIVELRQTYVSHFVTCPKASEFRK